MRLLTPAIIAILLSVPAMAKEPRGSPASAQKSKNAPTVSQRAKTVPAWNFTIEQGERRLKIVCTHDEVCADTGIFKFLIKSPDFERMILVSDEGRVYFPSTIMDFRRTFYGDNGGNKATDLHGLLFDKPEQAQYRQFQFGHLKLIGTEVKDGFTCQHYSGPWPGGTAQLWYTRDIDMDKRLSDAICRLGGMPTGYGLPVVAFVMNTAHTRRYEMSKLLNAKKTTWLTGNPFVPASYRLAKNQSELFFSGDKDNPTLDQLFEMPQTPVRKDK